MASKGETHFATTSICHQKTVNTLFVVQVQVSWDKIQIGLLCNTAYPSGNQQTNIYWIKRQWGVSIYIYAYIYYKAANHKNEWQTNQSNWLNFFASFEKSNLLCCYLTKYPYSLLWNPAILLLPVRLQVTPMIDF